MPHTGSIAPRRTVSHMSPAKAASATGCGPPPDSEASMRSRGTHACTTADTKNPSTSAHHTS